MASARNPIDFLAHEPLHENRQIVVEPFLQHRPQHLAHEILEGARVLVQHGICQPSEGGRHHGIGLRRHQPGGRGRRLLLQARLRFGRCGNRFGILRDRLDRFLYIDRIVVACELRGRGMARALYDRVATKTPFIKYQR